MSRFWHRLLRWRILRSLSMRPIVSLAPWWVSAWLLGTVLQMQQSHVLPLAWRFGFGISALTFLSLELARHCTAHRVARLVCQPLVFKLVLCMGTFCLSWSTLDARCWLQLQNALDPGLQGQDLRLVVEVASLPHFGNKGVKFKGRVLHATQVNTETEVKLPQWIELIWSEWDAPTSLDLPLWQTLTPGDQWQFQVRLKVPHGSLNPGGFDEELRLWELGVQATGSVRAGKSQFAPRKLSSSWHYPVDQLRQHVRLQIERALRNGSSQAQSSAGLIAALVMGDQAAITQADWQTFRATGVAHLMSISGLHITMLAWLVSAFIGRGWRAAALHGSSLCLRIPAPLAASLGGVLLASAYAIFCGWGLPAQRTMLMLLTMSLLRWQGLRWPWYWVWGGALWAIALWDPWALLQASFWLSFVAVGALILSDPGGLSVRTKLAVQDTEMVQDGRWATFRLILVPRFVQHLKSLTRTQWVVTVSLAPLSILFFGQLSVSGLLANLVAIPWVTLCITPLALAGLVWQPLWQVAAEACQPLVSALTWLATWPAGVLSFAQPPFSLIVLSLLGALICFQQWPWVVRGWGALWLLPVLVWQSSHPAWGQFELWALDVGQGNAVLVRTAHHALLYDTGPEWGDDADAGQRVLVPFMARLGTPLDRLVLSHRDADHTGGAASVLRSHPQAELWTSLEEGHPLSHLRDVHRCIAGEWWEWDGVRFEVLHPTPADYTAAKTSNGLSCVLRVDASQDQHSQRGHDMTGASALLVGDIEAPQEAALLQAQMLKSVDFLLVPHHGSQTSSTPAFVQTLKPLWAMVQAGYRNRYGHPAESVLMRYAQMEVPLASSAVCGAAYWQSLAPQRLDCERDTRRRYWHFKAP